MDYWNECVQDALEEAGLVATDVQIGKMAEIIEGAHEVYGECHGHDAIPNPLVEENNNLRKALGAEKEKVLCRSCGGSGRIISMGPCHGANMQCLRCDGEGKHTID